MEGYQFKRKSILKSKDNKQVKFIQKQASISTNQKNLKKKTSKNYQFNKSTQKDRKQYQTDTTKDTLTNIQKSFNMFFCKSLDFNQFVCGLKFIGVTIQCEDDFNKMVHIFMENNQQININNYVPIALKLINQQKAKNQANQAICIKKAFYYLLEEGNELNKYSKIYENVKDSNKQSEVLDNYKRQVQRLPKQSRFITIDTLKNIRKYLNRDDLSDQQLQQVFEHQMSGNDGYIGEQNCVQMINYNKIS